MLISNIYSEKMYLIELLNEGEKDLYNSVIKREANISEYKRSLKYLTDWLYKYHKEKVIVLIDEYDVPLQEGYLNDYYDEMIDLIRNIFSSTLKGNDSLKLGVLTGVLKVSGESLFSDFNNVKIYDVMSSSYNDYFGFTEKETIELLKYFGLELTTEVKEYYDGYNFSGTHIYNPWSIINYASDKTLRPYWIKTGSNSLIRTLLANISLENKIEIEELLEGKNIKIKYNEKITYKDFHNIKDLNIVLNLLFTSGYLTLAEIKENKITGEKETYYKIPNKEVKRDIIEVIENISVEREINTVRGYNEFLESLVEGNKEYIEEFINKLLKSVSYYDTYENFYHGYMLGLFSGFLSERYIVKSNREAGKGRYDLSIEKKDKEFGIIIEFKISNDENEIEEKALEGLKQMKEKEYYKYLEINGVKNIKEYVIVFSKKKCIVR